MSLQRLLRAATIALLFASACSPARPPSDIVLIVLDTVRQDRLSLYGYERETSPQLDRLAQRARVFDRAYSTSSWTSPAHASLFTGLHPAAHQVTQEQWSLAAGLTTLAEALSELGYEAAGFVANPNLSRERGFAQGFEHYTEAWRSGPGAKHRGETDSFLIARIEAFLAGRRSARPLFLFVNLIGAHAPYDSCGDHCDAFVSEPSIDVHDNQWQAFYLGRRSFSEPELRHLSERYDGEILALDHLVGRLVDSLRRTGHWSDALRIVTSDHGENLGEHGHVGHVFSLYETTTRIPLLVWAPEVVPSPPSDSRPVQLTDVFQTALRFAGAAAGETSDGVDLLGGDPAEERPVYTEYYRPVQAIGPLVAAWPDARPAFERYDRRIRSITLGGHKLIWGSDDRHELYDLAADPDERADVVNDAAFLEVRARLNERLDAFVAAQLREPAASPAPTISAAAQEALEALGYLASPPDSPPALLDPGPGPGSDRTD